MTAFPTLTKNDLNDKQRPLWDALTTGPRGFYTGGPDTKKLPDLYNAWLQFPAFGRQMLDLGDEIRHCPELPGKLREILVMTSSVILGARVEYEFHIPFARDMGLSDELIAAIGEGRTPPFADDAERIVYEANVQLVRTARLEDKTKEEIIKLLGFNGLMQVIAAITLYVAVAYTTNVARVKLADDFSADPEMLKDFFSGRTESAKI